MASCHKCGRLKLRKAADGNKWCRRCGVLPGQGNLDRSALASLVKLDTQLSVRGDSQQIERLQSNG